MVAHHKTDSSIQPAEPSIPFFRTADSEVSQMKNEGISFNNLIPVANDGLVHLFNGGERTMTMVDDIPMSEVGIRCEEYRLLQ
jgi:hypothetical protein